MFLSSLFIPAFAITAAIRTNVLETKQHYRHEVWWIVALMFYVLLRGNQRCIHQNKQKFGQRVQHKGAAIYFTLLSREQQMLPFCVRDVSYTSQRGYYALCFIHRCPMVSCLDCLIICLYFLVLQTAYLIFLFLCFQFIMWGLF